MRDPLMSRTTTSRARSTTDLSRITLGPVDTGAYVIRLRGPQLSDAALWREIRLRDRRWIEPYSISSPLAWERRHTARRWARECMVAWADMRAGRRYSAVIEVDGEFAGQAEFYVVDTASRTVEFSGWIDSRWAGRRVMVQISAMVVQYLFTSLGVTRIIAPIAPDNEAAVRCVRSLGFRREATMALSFDAGGAPRDHALWALTPADVPAGGYPGIETSAVRQSATPPAPPRATGGPSPAVVATAATRLLAWRIWHRLRWRPRIDPVSLTVPHHPAVVVHTLTPTRRRRTPRSPAGLILVLRVDGRYAGGFRFYDPELPGHALGLYSWADPGLATVDVRAAALRAVVDYGFTTLGLRRISAEIPTGDPVAPAVAAAAHFTREGVLRDHCGPTGLRTDHALWATTAPTPDEGGS
ncbi:GNAT family N-acetyltransferase [Nocardia sp. NPDC058176]|uniref:GNAT family N-acetyltransferase n=1 Tax=Nocardia sp. NPDC058176 TaxID=3346368 RepID=UPI0036D917C3